MGFLDYSNETQTNIFPKENFEELVHEVFNIVSSNICKSLGPLGSSATILEGLLPPEATKDGYHILESYKFRNDYKRMIYHLIKAPCTRMNNIVGDGTTTAIDLTTEMFNRYTARKSVLDTLYRLPRQFTRVWDDVIDELQQKVMSKAKAIDPKDYTTIYNIAHVTSNGNDEVSKAIATVYAEAEAPYIKQKESLTNKSYIETVIGFNFPAHLISDAYVKNDDMSTAEDDIAVMVFSFKLETDVFENVIIPINEVYRAKGKRLLVIAPSFDARTCDTLLAQYTMKERHSMRGINLILAQYLQSDLSDRQLLDLCVILKAKIINDVMYGELVSELSVNSVDKIIDLAETDPEYKLSRLVGFAEHAQMSTFKESGCLFRVDDGIFEDDVYKDTMRSAKNALEELLRKADKEQASYSHKIYNARNRILQLEMKNYVYYVGADSSLQRKILWDSITDVIKCVRSAVKHGVVPGCQLSVIRSCTEMIDEVTAAAGDDVKFDDLPDDVKLKIEIIMMIKTACMAVYSHVITGPEGTGIIKTLPRWQYTTEEGVKELVDEGNKKTRSIINESIERNEVFDLETLTFNDKIITSAETDQLVLLAASELVKVLISGNQAIIIRADVDASHEEQMNM